MPTIKSSPPPAPMGMAAVQRPPKRYDEAFQHQAVENSIRSGKPGAPIARQLGLSYPALKDWKHRYYGDAVPRRADLEAAIHAAMESFMATYKRECVALAKADGAGYAIRSEATADFFAYVESYYNRQRRHSALGYQSPLDFESNVN